MSHHRVIALVDHHSALIQHIEGAEVRADRLKEHNHATRQHGSSVRTEHEFFGKVCDALADAGEILIAGHNTALADFRHYTDKHRPQLAPRIVGWETVDHPTDGQLVALARKVFDHYDRMAGKKLI